MNKIEKKKETLFMHEIIQEWAQYHNSVLSGYNYDLKSEFVPKINLESFKEFEAYYWKYGNCLRSRVHSVVMPFTDNVAFAAKVSELITNYYLKQQEIEL